MEQPIRPNTRAIITELERRSKANCEAVNNRDFSPATSALYRGKSSKWTAQASIGSTVHNLDEHVHSIQRVCNEYPDFRIRVVDMHTTVNDKADFAELYVNTESSNAPPGVSRPSVSIVVYRLIRGEWLSVHHMSLAGLPAEGSSQVSLI
ncbi:hypothetical protein CLAFUW4_01787 [Fulvia fulva]|uniref:SnoaL-like domain-containing protein n=1 Tax=Passalora fulva TaxID=5499 RepID=A0A9Q8L5K7_PASFU|nr:uncharacterized protein CLAFUR5_01783 [Fulvia fulva]KAK4635446.1 hypothetical protein CLAFUR4_01785 [Fulvia fulva]KAK4636976.1 hypothetical protein CLAFUR0_01787 [Fulvia fulva]UJO11246.1 hypothetical protein CLAFUR5_01783 [Fulvia fulva]WPV08995.1 hypothetical protein CLAFUW4_01787 [Fulvia fulva]WPV24185.1 hypothetical protein CLAFUW7_01788 [Fulvia fulva]